MPLMKFKTCFMKCFYNQTCFRQPLLRPLKIGNLGQAVFLENAFIKLPLARRGRSE